LGARAAAIGRLGPGSNAPWLLLLFREAPEAAAAEDAARAALGSFALAADAARLERDLSQEVRLRTLMLAFSRASASIPDMTSAFAALCEGLEPLFGAARVSAWLHERRARELVFQASSDPMHMPGGSRVAADESDQLAVRGLRRERPEIAADRVLLVPLRGRRRALGTIILEGATAASGADADLLALAEELARQLSGAIENRLLFEDVLRSRRELQDTFNSLVDLVAVCDPGRRIVHVNRAFAERAGGTRETLFERPLEQFVAPATFDWIASLDLSRPTSDRDAATRELEDGALGGTFSMTVTALRTQEGEPAGVVLVARDVTQQAALQAERVALNDRLTQSEKLAALGQFVAGIAHELNNPLQGVLGHLELLRGNRRLPRALAPDLRLIYREADRAAKIVNNLLVFAGSRRAARRPVSANASLARALELRARACREAGIDIIRRLDRRVPRIIGDALLLQQAFLNIILNAEQAIAARAAVVGGVGLQADRIEASTARERGIVVVEIRDTGPGIPADVLPRIFEPFFTTKDVGKGTGLGLALTYGIIHEHGGSIAARSHPEGGALFRIELPDADSARFSDG
jgi:two-component system NtrC family sensor kinase